MSSLTASLQKHHTLCRSGVIVLMTSAALVLGGCGDTPGPEARIDVGEIQNDQAGDGTYDDFARIQSFEGQQVTVTADVVQIVAPNAFTIADMRGEQRLVVHRELAPNVAVNSPVQVTGTAKKTFDIAVAEQFAGADFDDLAFRPYFGEPYIQASNIDTTVTTETGPASPHRRPE